MRVQITLSASNRLAIQKGAGTQDHRHWKGLGTETVDLPELREHELRAGVGQAPTQPHRQRATVDNPYAQASGHEWRRPGSSRKVADFLLDLTRDGGYSLRKWPHGQSSR
jgi:hypothetical protein